MYEYATSGAIFAQKKKKRIKGYANERCGKYFIHVVFCRVTPKKNDKHGNRHNKKIAEILLTLFSPDVAVHGPIPLGLPRWRMSHFLLKKKRKIWHWCIILLLLTRHDTPRGRNWNSGSYFSAKLTAKQERTFFGVGKWCNGREEQFSFLGYRWDGDDKSLIDDRRKKGVEPTRVCVVVQDRRAAVIGRLLIASRTGPKNKVILSAVSHHSAARDCISARQ